MAFDEDLDARVGDYLMSRGATRKLMFGGTGYLLGGNMAAGVHRDSLVLRLSEDDAAAALARPGFRPFDITGRPMRGWVMADPAAVEADLADWLVRASAFAESLPPK